MYQHYRFTVLQLRSRADCVGGLSGGEKSYDGLAERETELGRVQVHQFGMLHNGLDARFRLHVENQRNVSQRWERGDTLILSFQQPVPTNGFYFVTAEEGTDVACDPVRFSVTASNAPPSADPRGCSSMGEGGRIREDCFCERESSDGALSEDFKDWTQVGSSSFSFDRRPPAVRAQYPYIYVFEDGEFGTSVSRQHLHAFDLSAPAFKLGVCTLTVLTCLGATGGAALLGFLKQPARGKTFLTTATYLVFVGHLTGMTFKGRHVLSHVLCSFSCMILFRYGDNRNFVRNATFTFSAWAVVAIHDCDLYLFLVGAMGALYWGKSWYEWRLSVATSASIVQDDLVKYNNAWQQLIREEDVCTQLEALRTTCEQLPGGLGACGIRSRPTTHLFRRRGFSGGEEERDPEPQVEVMSLDHVYHQAYCIHPMLRRKVQDLALRYRGYFLCKHLNGDAEYVLWKSLAPHAYVRGDCFFFGEDSGERQVMFTGLKRAERAIQKVVRCYGRNVSHLVDICRENIVFDSVSDLRYVCLCACAHYPRC